MRKKPAMPIPTSVWIGKKKYRITHPEVLDPPWATGKFDTSKTVLEVKTAPHPPRSKVPRRPEQVSETFWHELTHAILYEMNPAGRKHKDEKFVKAFAKLLNQAVLTAKFAPA